MHTVVLITHLPREKTVFSMNVEIAQKMQLTVMNPKKRNKKEGENVREKDTGRRICGWKTESLMCPDWINSIRAVPHAPFPSAPGKPRAPPEQFHRWY